MECHSIVIKYYACLCGYYEIVEYLLVNGGAKCDLKTFQGERCYYAALEDKTRNLLVNEKVLEEGLMNSSPFYSFCKQVLHSKENSNFHYLNTTDEAFYVHEFFLTARGASAFYQRVMEDEEPVRNEDYTLIELVLEYLYTARIIFPSKRLEDLRRFAVKYKLDVLSVELSNWDKSHITRAKHSKVKIDSNEGKLVLKSQLCALIQNGMSKEFKIPFTITGGELMGVSLSSYCDTFTGFDLCLTAENEKFYAHKVMLSNRSEYFSTFIMDPLYEREVDGDFQVLRFGDISASSLACILYHVYTEDIIPTLNIQNVLEVLNYANMWLLPGLVKQCANFMSNHITEQNVIQFIKISRLYNLYKLESTCVRFITTNLKLMIEDSGFRDLVLEDANEISNREATDSIPIIDDIHGELRWLEIDINNSCGTEVGKKRKLIQSLLSNLNLEIIKIDKEVESVRKPHGNVT